MLTARSGEGASTGTLLANGKVLFVAGDKDGPSYEQLASAELYDPTKGTFSPTGSMTYTRTGERETLLLDGRVLVSGGTFTTPVAELYDPTSGAFSLTGSLITERSAHTATLLPNGTVLIAGGYNNTQVFSSAELYTLQITAKIQPPINSDGSSVFKASRGVVPVKFALVDGPASCNLPNATISLTRIAGGVIGTIDEADYLSSADSGPNFRISDCQYVYNLASKALGIGTYRVDISIAASVVGSAVFGLK